MKVDETDGVEVGTDGPLEGNGVIVRDIPVLF